MNTCRSNTPNSQLEERCSIAMRTTKRGRQPEEFTVEPEREHSKRLKVMRKPCDIEDMDYVDDGPDEEANRTDPFTSDNYGYCGIDGNGDQSSNNSCDLAANEDEQKSQVANSDSNNSHSSNSSPTGSKNDKSSQSSSSAKKEQAAQLIKEKQEQCQKMMLLLSQFSDEQLSRYEVFRRSKFSKNLIKRVVKDATNHNINERVAFAMAGIAKVFVGQIVECGLDFMAEIGDTGPLKPKHIREAVRRIKRPSGKPSRA